MLNDIAHGEPWTLKEWWFVFRDTFKKFFEENPFRYSAAIAYYTIFSLPGIAIISIMIAGSFYEYDAVRNELINQVRLLMGETSAKEVRDLIQDAGVAYGSSLVRIIGVATVVISATTVFVSLQESINSIWKIKPKPKRGIVKFIVNRLLSLAMIASIGFLILVSLMIDTLLSLLKSSISGFFSEGSYYLVYFLNLAISIGIIIGVFGLMFKVLPDAKLKWKHVWVGAIITAVLFVIGKYLISFYLGKSNVGDAYGAAGSLVVMLSWVYYSVMILLFGAQFTFVYNKRRGNRIMPDKEAVVIKIKEVEAKNLPVNNV